MVQIYTGNKSTVLTKATLLLGDLGLSSLHLVNLACEVEEEFDLEIPDRENEDPRGKH